MPEYRFQYFVFAFLFVAVRGVLRNCCSYSGGTAGKRITAQFHGCPAMNRSGRIGIVAIKSKISRAVADVISASRKCDINWKINKKITYGNIKVFTEGVYCVTPNTLPTIKSLGYTPCPC